MSYVRLTYDNPLRRISTPRVAQFSVSGRSPSISTTQPQSSTPQSINSTVKPQPVIDGLAKDGVLFENAVTQAPSR